MNKKSGNKLARLMAVMADGEFHDGNALGDALAMTRSAVWKMIKKLERYGIEINSIKGRGYALCEPLILLEEDLIRQHIADKNCHISLFESIDSTNEYLKKQRQHKGVQVCIAEQQEHGKGRLGREWSSPFGRNMYFSCSYLFQRDISELSGLSLVVGLAIVSVLNQFGLKDCAKVKWPNDVVCEMQKIAGTLIELQAESHGLCQAVIGIGLNVNMLLDERRQITQSWTSMRRISGKYYDRNVVAAALINTTLDYLQRFDAHGLDIFANEWQAADAMIGKNIALKSSRDTVSGTASGVNAQGHLLLKMNDGELRAFSSGDTTVIKK